MSGRLYDIVVYGATGVTGKCIVQAIASNALFHNVTIAVAGRNESKLRDVLDEVAAETGCEVAKSYSIVIADNSDESSLARMAQQCAIIINAVGPFRLYGEAVVRAAVENGANHIDLAGEPHFLENTEAKYDRLAKERGVYVIGACGLDSVACDLGVDYLKRNFEGTLAYVETFVKLCQGPSGYAFNATTYHTLIHGLSSTKEDNLGALRRSIMPYKMPTLNARPPKRSTLWHPKSKDINGWAIPFMGSDGPVVRRSQYYDHYTNGKQPALVNTYFTIEWQRNAILLTLWLTALSTLSQFEFVRNILHKYPEQFSFNMFKNSGPTKQQMKEASFEYFFFGKGYSKGKEAEEGARVDKEAAAVCRGPDPGYIAAAGFAASSALALLRSEGLPEGGGVLTSASAFRDTSLLEYLETFGISFRMLPHERAHL